MTANTVRGSLRQAAEEIQDICETAPLADETEDRLAGIAEQLDYLVEGDPTDPEALAGPDPDTLDTIRDQLAVVVAESEGDTATRLERARDEVLHALSVLDDQVARQRHERPNST